FKEILPNLLPFIAASFVGQVFGAVFASFYLAVLGLGPLREPLLGNLIWAAQGQGAFFNGWWWWPLIPAFAMILILGALALVNMGLDELANPRVRRTE
ncbi:MAG: ABC transporter permease subunit, partial [Alphaproteobacteria bacterium]